MRHKDIMNIKKIVIVDDHPVVNYAISHVLAEKFADIQIHSVLSAREMRALLESEKTAETKTHYLMAFVDINLPDANGIELMRELRTRYGIPVIAISSNANADRVRECINCGTVGFIEKTAKLDIYPAAVNFILAGGTFFPSQYRVRRPLRPLQDDPASTLTGRQKDVLELLLEGKSNKTIGATLGLCEGTVKNHVSALLKLFCVDSRSQLVANTKNSYRTDPRFEVAQYPTVTEAI